MESPLPGSIHGTSTFELLAALGRDWTAWAQPAGAAPNLAPSRRGEPMASVQEIRQRLRGQRIETLRSRIEPLLTGRAGAEVWLFGSLARGDWDARATSPWRPMPAREVSTPRLATTAARQPLPGVRAAATSPGLQTVRNRDRNSPVASHWRSPGPPDGHRCKAGPAPQR